MSAENETEKIVGFRPRDGATLPPPVSSKPCFLTERTFSIDDRFPPRNTEEFYKRQLLQVRVPELVGQCGVIEFGDSYSMEYEIGKRGAARTVRLYAGGPKGPWSRSFACDAQHGEASVMCPRCVQAVSVIGYWAGSGGREFLCSKCSDEAGGFSWLLHPIVRQSGKSRRVLASSGTESDWTFISASPIRRAAGASSVAELIILARQGDLKGSGTIEFRRKGEILGDTLQFAAHQIDSPNKDYRYAVALEIGRPGQQPECVTLLLSPGRALLCPVCGETASRDWGLYLSSSGKAVAHSKCMGGRHSNMSAYVRTQPRSIVHRQVRPSFDISVTGKTGFFGKHPKLFETLPAIFVVRKEDEYQPIGYFVADRRILPIVKSRKVRVDL